MTSQLPCILVVEDETLLRMVVVEALQALGFQAMEAGSAAEAQAKLQQHRVGIDGLLIDVGLPDGRGDAIAAAMRTTNPRLPIIISSGYDVAALRQQFAGDDLIGVLGKPYDDAQLEAMLRGLGLEAPKPAKT